MFEHTGQWNVIGITLVTVMIAAVVIDRNSWRIGSLKWRFHTWKNRRKHPSLAPAYNNATDAKERFLIAQQMMMFDRRLERMVHNGAPGPDYPNVWDYHFEPGKLAYRMMVSRVVRRKADEKRIQDELKRIKTKAS